MRRQNVSLAIFKEYHIKGTPSEINYEQLIHRQLSLEFLKIDSVDIDEIIKHRNLFSPFQNRYSATLRKWSRRLEETDLSSANEREIGMLQDEANAERISNLAILEEIIKDKLMDNKLLSIHAAGFGAIHTLDGVAAHTLAYSTSALALLAQGVGPVNSVKNAINPEIYSVKKYFKSHSFPRSVRKKYQTKK